jgi:hypothetical protein
VCEIKTMKSDFCIAPLPKAKADPVFLDFTASEHEAGISVPDRSRLIGLPPKGLGTSQVESLFSYLLRLAEAHAVRFVDLVQHVIGPMVYRTCVENVRFRTCHRLQQGVSAGEIPVIEGLTLQSRLRELTLAPAKNLKCVHVDYAPSRAWCPACILADEEPYERLVWQVKGVTHCPVHCIKLERACPECGALQNCSNFTVHIRKCIKCGADRMSRIDASHEPDDPGIWRSQECAKFLIWATSQQPRGSSPFDNFRANIVTISKVAGGWKPLARSLGIPSSSFNFWKLGVGVPELEKVLSIAWCANISVIDGFEREVTESEIRIRAIHSSIRKPRPYKKRLRIITPSLLLEALDNEIKAHPFEKIFIKTIFTALDVSPDSPISLGAEFRSRLNAHNEKTRKLRRHACVREAAIGLRTAILALKSSGAAVTAANVSKLGTKPEIKMGAWLLPRTRQIFHRMVSIMNGNKPLPDLALRMPPDMQAFLDWKASKKRR